MITKNIGAYLVNLNLSIREAIKKLESTEEKTLIILNDDDSLHGILTDGDIRRWLIKTKTPDLESPVIDACCKQPKFKYENQVSATHANQTLKILPILNDKNRVVGIEKKLLSKIQIREHEIGPGFPCFIIAEIGNNHNGDLNLALKMIDKAIEAGVNCVKFQMRNLGEVYRERTLLRKGDDLGVEYVVDILSRFELSIDQHRKIYEYCAHRGILYMCTPWDQISLEILESFGVHAYKVASADFSNIPLIKRIVATGKPIILSTGMSDRQEIQFVTEILNNLGSQFALLHCNSTYPAPPHDINLRWMDELKRIHPVAGYSGHERGIEISLAAVALGANIIERHFTLDRSMEGPDHLASLEFQEFKQLVSGIRTIELALGGSSEKDLSQGVLMNKENLSKSLVSTSDIAAGTIIMPHHIKIRSPGQGLSPVYYDKLIGTTLKRNIKEEDFFYQSDINNTTIRSKNYSFKADWGIPVRFHDIEELSKAISPKLYEFHLSYRDLDLRPENFIKHRLKADLIVHAPELFSDSHLLDLAAHDEKYREKSITEMQKVIDFTKRLSPYFESRKLPKIITNIGGFSQDIVFTKNQFDQSYAFFKDSLARLNLENVQILPQTMPPFPWHFGGQRFHNLFITSEDIKAWCNELNINICLDVSHSFLACQNLGVDFYHFVSEVSPYTSHLHLSDARGINGEGLQIGAGDIDFVKLQKSLVNDDTYPQSFIPEIWQGHKNGGEGFWIALNTLESFNLY